MARNDVLQTVDDAARRQARGLMRTARSGALACLEPVTGVPLASRVSVACEVEGAPVILISELSAHFAALDGDARCSLLLGEVGTGDPLAHARMTVVSHAARLEGDARTIARDRFLRQHPKAALYADFGDFAFWRLTPERAALNAGFGRAYALEAADLTGPTPDGLTEMEPGAVAHMNEGHGDAIAALAASAGMTAGTWRMTGVDADGFDLTDGAHVARLWFDPPLRDADEVRGRLVAMVKQARGESA